MTEFDRTPIACFELSPLANHPGLYPITCLGGDCCQSLTVTAWVEVLGFTGI